MMLQIMAIIGFMMAGYILPEISILLGSGKHPAPAMLNIIGAVSAAFISSYFIFSV